MKKWIALTLTLLFALALFAGCSNSQKQDAPATSAPSTKAPATSAPAAETPASQSAEPAPPEEESPYHLAAGKYAKNAEGYPAEKYAYDQPLCTNDEVLTNWTTCFTPQYIPEGGWGEVPTWKGVREFTGVHMEYDMVDPSERSLNFSVLLAADSLDDIMDGAKSFYKAGTLKSAVTDGYFANMYLYLDYLPNYMYEIYTRSQFQADMIPKLFYDSETIPALYGMVINPAPAMGYFLRQDWMDEMGMGQAGDVKTYDQLYAVLTAMKTNYSTAEREIFPFLLNNVGEQYQGCLFSGYDTTIYLTGVNTYPRVKDGKVEFCGTTEDCRGAFTLLSQWHAEGLISPNWHSFDPGGDYDAGQNTDGLGCNLMPPSSWDSAELQSINPNTDWEPIPRTKKTEDQVLKYGYAKARDNFSYGSCSISGKCENIPLAASWVDWGFSEFGAEWTGWGPEGYIWEYNSEGERRLTDWCLNHEAGSAWIMCIYCCSGLIQCCMEDYMVSYYYDGGERAMSAFDVFRVSGYKGEYDWPGAVSFTDDEQEETTALFSDLNTYYSESASAFIDGSKPMSEWDSYTEGLRSFGLERVMEIYQDAYDRYLERIR